MSSRPELFYLISALLYPDTASHTFSATLLGNDDLIVNSFLQLGNMGNNPYQASAICKAVQRF